MLTQEVIAWLQALSTLFAFLALMFSIVAVYFTVVTFRLKKKDLWYAASTKQCQVVSRQTTLMCAKCCLKTLRIGRW